MNNHSMQTRASYVTEFVADFAEEDSYQVG